jgi:hypothetical protein
MSDEHRAEIEAGLAEEVAWAINYLRGIQSEINDLHRDGRLKVWDRSRLHDLIRCVVDGVQGRVGLERALRGEVSTTAERSASALDRLRDARGDDDEGRPHREPPMQSDDQIEEPMDYSPIRSSQGEDHEKAPSEQNADGG